MCRCDPGSAPADDDQTGASFSAVGSLTVVET
jgi:hypothetical protein